MSVSDNKMSDDQPGWFIVVRPKNVELRLFFPDDRLTGNGVILGRAPNCDIVIDDPSLSRQHCRILLTMGKLQVTDVGSKNGVFVAGKRIAQGEYATLAANDQLRLGGERDGIDVVIEKRDPQDLPDGTMLIDEYEDDRAGRLSPPLRTEPGNGITFGGAVSDNKGPAYAPIDTLGMAPWSTDEKAPIPRRVEPPRTPPAKKPVARTFSPLLAVAGVVVLAASIGIGGYVAKNRQEMQETPMVATASPPPQIAPVPSPPVPKETIHAVLPNSSSTLSTIREITPSKKRVLGNTTGEQYRNIEFGNFSALVIGNNAYRYVPKLDNAVLDAEAVADTLVSNYGFGVTMILNGTRTDTLSTLDRIRGKLTPRDNFLIFFAGHGVYDQASDRGYWLPVDAQPDTRANWISNADITDSMRAIQAKHILVVADSCYSGTMTRSVEIELPTPSLIERINSHRSRTVLASGGIEPVVDGGGASQHSIFTSAFLDTLKKNTKIIDGSGLFSQIRDPVRLNAEQMPIYSDIRNANHEPGGDFLFIRR
ncbi:hypothetical protein CCP3SC15_90026 [Gammaproteobacteria bacterium]